jgi:hypothetical protein
LLPIVHSHLPEVFPHIVFPSYSSRNALKNVNLTHWGRVTQICAFTLQRCRTGEANLRFNTRLVSTRYILNYAVHGTCLRMVLLMDVYRNVTSLRFNRLRVCYKFLKKQTIKVELQCLEPGNGGLNNLNARSAMC